MLSQSNQQRSEAMEGVETSRVLVYARCLKERSSPGGKRLVTPKPSEKLSDPLRYTCTEEDSTLSCQKLLCRKQLISNWPVMAVSKERAALKYIKDYKKPNSWCLCFWPVCSLVCGVECLSQCWQREHENRTKEFGFASILSENSSTGKHEAAASVKVLVFAIIPLCWCVY